MWSSRAGYSSRTTRWRPASTCSRYRLAGANAAADGSIDNRRFPLRAVRHRANFVWQLPRRRFAHAAVVALLPPVLNPFAIPPEYERRTTVVSPARYCPCPRLAARFGIPGERHGHIHHSAARTPAGVDRTREGLLP